MAKGWTCLAAGAAVLVLVGSAVYLSGPAGAGSAAEGPRITMRPPTYDFGTLSMAKGKVQAAFALANTGNRPLTVRAIGTS